MPCSIHQAQSTWLSQPGLCTSWVDHQPGSLNQLHSLAGDIGADTCTTWSVEVLGTPNSPRCTLVVVYAASLMGCNAGAVTVEGLMGEVLLVGRRPVAMFTARSTMPGGGIMGSVPQWAVCPVGRMDSDIDTCKLHMQR